MEPCNATVLLIDDDPDVRDGISRLLRSAGWLAETFASGQDFLARTPFDGVGCVLLDISMPGMTGPELHAWMRAHDMSLPVIYLSGHADVPTSVHAMKQGALDVLEKPVDADVLLGTIAAAVERHYQDRLHRVAAADVSVRLASLSPREREVLEHVVTGQLNKQIAFDLGIAEKTVKVHRGRMMAKMRVRSVVALMRLCDEAGISRSA